MTQAAAHTMISIPPRACGHADHHGTCGCCQRAQKARWAAQLAQVTAAATRRADAAIAA